MYVIITKKTNLFKCLLIGATTAREVYTKYPGGGGLQISGKSYAQPLKLWVKSGDGCLIPSVLEVLAAFNVGSLQVVPELP